MDTELPQTPDVDLPGQAHVEADLDIVVEPAPDDDPADGDADPHGDAGDPAVGNTLIRPENS